jgi:acyl-CoA hydrolase
VEIEKEDPLTRTRVFVNKVYITFVALDEHGHKRKTISFLPQTDEEQREYDAAKERKAR